MLCLTIAHYGLLPDTILPLAILERSAKVSIGILTLYGYQLHNQAANGGRDRIDQAIKLLSGNGTGTRGGIAPTPAKAAGKRGGRRKMSAAARKRISDAQQARWAKQRKAKA